REILVILRVRILRPRGRAYVVDRGARAIDKSLGFEARGARDPDRRIEQLARPAKTNERAALESLAAAGAEKLGIGVEQRRGQRIDGKLRDAGRLLEAGRGGEDIIRQERRLLLRGRQYCVEQTILASLETSIAVGGLRDRHSRPNCRKNQDSEEWDHAGKREAKWVHWSSPAEMG